MKPEQYARQTIDELLTMAGWKVQDRKRMNLGAGRGIAVREFSVITGEADYLLFIDRKAVGVVEAKKMGTTLTGVEEQSGKYRRGIPAGLPAERVPLPFAYETTGIETRFTSYLDPVPCSRQVFAFHRPEMLALWLSQAPVGVPNEQNDTLRARLLRLPPLAAARLRICQIEAITNLERSFAENRPRALIQMATGSGKTYMAVSSIYRLIKFGGAQRILFLVDRANLARQTLNEFQQYETPDDGRKFTELYNVQHLQSNTIDRAAKVCITTIQRLYAILCGEPLDPADEELSLFEQGRADTPPKHVQYNPAVPIETFDIIFTDECHRSIYNLWSEVLTYFDASIVGLTATPNKQTYGFFKQNLVMEYGHERAVADGVNVDYQVYRIRTAITEQGSTIEPLSFVGRRERRTRATRWEQLDDDLTYSAQQLDRDVVAPDQIRTVIRTYRDALKTTLFPHRKEVPKTLIFAKDDSHADEIVQIVREEFGEGNEIAQKITYRTTGVKAEELIASFRNSYYPRIAVTVDMIATGTDIKPLEVLLFMRSVKSRGLFEQMKGRGSRSIANDEFQAVTPAPEGKTHFVIVDAVGVCEQEKMDNAPLERKPSVPFKKLLDDMAVGKWQHDEDLLLTLASRLGRLSRIIRPDDAAHLAQLAGGRSLTALAGAIVNALDPDKLLERAQAESGNPYLRLDALEVQETAQRMILEAVAPFDDPDFREALLAVQQRDEQIIDIVSKDEVVAAGWDVQAEEQARRTVQNFRAFLEQHRDEITALEIFYSRPRGQRLTLKDIKRLAEAIAAPPLGLTTDKLWQAYETLDSTRVHANSGSQRMLTDLVALIRYTLTADQNEASVLEPYSALIERRFAAWLEQQERARGRAFTGEQRQWLLMIRDAIANSLTIEAEDFDYEPFAQRGGLARARQLFGSELPTLLQDLNDQLAA
jgi:type I restriction enzyme R subunit